MTDDRTPSDDGLRERVLTVTEAEDVARWLRAAAGDGLTLRQEARALALRIADRLAAVPQPETPERCPGCGNSYADDNFCMPSACQWEGIVQPSAGAAQGEPTIEDAPVWSCPDPDAAVTGDGRVIAAAVNALTEQVAHVAQALRLAGAR